MLRNNTPSKAVNPKLENTPTFYSDIAASSTAFAPASRVLERGRS
jgi:hypothetical protein